MLYLFVIFPPALATAASIAMRAEGVTEMMYLPFAPKSIADAGTAVIPIDVMMSATRSATRNLRKLKVNIKAPWEVRLIPLPKG